MKAFFAVACGGAVGATARYAVYLLSGHYLGHAFPYGTVIVNVVGSFVMGVLIEVMALAWSPSEETRLFLVVGILGAFTTFSTFSLDFAVLYERGKLGLSAAYLLMSVTLSIAGLFSGMYMMRRLL